MVKGPGIWSRLVIGFFLFAFLPLSVMGFFLFKSGKDDTLRATEENLSSLIHIVKNEIESFTTNVLQDTRTIARTPGTATLARELLRGKNRERARDEMRNIFLAHLHAGGDIEAYFLLHPETGEVLVSTDKFSEGKFFDKRPFFELGRERPNIYRLHYSPASEKSILAASAPVRKRDELLGVIVTWANLDYLKNLLDFASDTRVYLVNRSNLYVLDSKTGKGSPSILTGVSTEAARKALNEETGIDVYTDPDGVKAVGAYTYLESLDIALIAETPLSSIARHATAIGQRILLMTLVLAVFVLFVSVLAAGKVTRPLIRMSQVAEGISLGRLDQRIDYSSNDELGLLSESMNRMAENLTFREKELKEAVSTLNTLVEHIPQGIALLDAKNRIVLTNPMGEELLNRLEGVGQGDILTDISGLPIDDFLVSPPQIMWHEVEKDGPSGGVFEVAARHLGLDETEGTVLVLKDATEEKKIEDLTQSQERLAAVGQLASGIAHDFNNILTCVIGFSEMLMADKELPPDVRQQVDAIQQSGKRAADLITQILDFSRKSASEFKVIDLGVLVSEFLKFIQRTIPENIKVFFDADEGEYPLKADLTKIQQVLANLAVNGRDAMPHGGKLGFSLLRIRVRAKDSQFFPGMKPGAWLLLTVFDTGEGIPPEVLPRIFEPFFTTKAEGEGTGLGLAQVYGIVKQHGGYIDVKSERGKGTSFFLYFPEAGDKAEPEEDEADHALPAGKGQTVLVVEDDMVVRDLICKELNGLGFRLLSASDGESALKIFATYGKKVDILVTDMVMTGIDGIDLSKKLRKENPDLKIVAISGYVPKDREKELVKEGFMQWLQKPFNMKQLAQAISRASGLDEEGSISAGRQGL